MEKIPSRILDTINIVHLIVTLNVPFYSVFNKAQCFDHMCLYFSIFQVSIAFQYLSALQTKFLFFILSINMRQLSPNSNHT